MALCALVVGCAAGLLGPTALAAPGDPTVLWSEYPLDPSRASRGPGAGRVEGEPAAASVTPVNAGALVGSPDEASGVPVWLVLLLVSTTLALAGMVWLTLAALRQAARWSVEPAAPRRRSLRPPRRNASSNGSVPLDAPEERTSVSGIRYRD